MWRDERFAVTHQCSANFHGDNEFSEPETVAIRDFLQKSSGRVKLFLTVHAAGEKIIIPWGHNNKIFDKTFTINRLMEVGRKAMGTNGANYTIGNLIKAFNGVGSLF